MDMSWQAMLHDAAAVSFERNAESLATENRTRSYVDLSHAQVLLSLAPRRYRKVFPTETRKGTVPLLSRAVIFLYGGQCRADDFR